MAERIHAQGYETDGRLLHSRVDAAPTRPSSKGGAGALAGVLARQPNIGNKAIGRLARELADRSNGGGRARRLARQVSDSHPNAKALNTAQDVLAEGKVWTEQHYSEALLTDGKLSNRAGALAYGRALQNVEIEMTRKQQARQDFAPVLDDLTESRIRFRRDALWEIGQKKSVKQGVSAAEAKTDDPDAREQIRLVAADMKLIQDDFRSRAYDNAYRMLDDSAREVGAMLSSYGVLIAAAWDVVGSVRVYEGDLEHQASEWLETARLANTSGYSDPQKSKRRKDLGGTLHYLRQLQQNVKRQQRAHLDPTSLVTGTLGPAIAPISSTIAVVGPKRADHPDVKRAKAELAAAWINAERDHPVLAGYRADHDDELEDVSLGSLGSSEKDDMQAVVENGMRILANILTAKLALRQKKVSPYELGPVVALTRAQMLIRRGSVWDIAVEELMRGDDDGADWAKAAVKVALSALMLFPGTWLLALASVGLSLYSAGQEYVRYGLDKALAGTSLDRAKALSSKTPSLAGFAWALVGAGLDAVGARAAFGEAEALSAKVLAGDEEAVAALNKLGESRGVGHLGDDVAKTRPAAPQPTLVPPRSAHVPPTEEAAGTGAGARSRISPVDRGKGSRPFYAKDPKKPPTREPGGSGSGRARPVVTAPTGGAATPRLVEFRRRIENFERTVSPKEVHGAPEGPGGSAAGHARSKHGWTDEMVADLLNKPGRKFSGWNESTPPREVDIYWRNGDVAITEAGNKTSVITAYGKSSPKKPSFVPPKWADDSRYVEIKPQEVTYPNRERWEADDWPGPPPAPTGAPAPPAAPASPAPGGTPAPTPTTR